MAPAQLNKHCHLLWYCGTSRARSVLQPEKGRQGTEAAFSLVVLQLQLKIKLQALNNPVNKKKEFISARSVTIIIPAQGYSLYKI